MGFEGDAEGVLRGDIKKSNKRGEWGGELNG